MTYGEGERAEREEKLHSALLADLPARHCSASQGVALAEKGLVPPLSAMTSAFKVQKAALFGFFIVRKETAQHELLQHKSLAISFPFHFLLFTQQKPVSSCSGIEEIKTSRA